MFIVLLLLICFSLKTEAINISKEKLQCQCGCGEFNYDTNFLNKLKEFNPGDDLKILITSGDRCYKHNHNIGGVDDSLHVGTNKKATAVDITGKDCKKIYNLAIASGLFNEVEYHINLNFVHLGYDKKQKGNFFKIWEI